MQESCIVLNYGEQRVVFPYKVGESQISPHMVFIEPLNSLAIL